MRTLALLPSTTLSHLTDQWYRLEQLSNITLSLRRTYRDYINLIQSLARFFPRLCIFRGANLERRHYGRRHWRFGNDGRIWTLLGKDSMQKMWEDKIQKLRYVLVHNFLRKLCYGSKKWRWLNQWTISNPRVLSEELQELLVQTLSYLTREFLQQWTTSSRIPAFKKEVSLEEMKDRFLWGRQIAYLIYEYFRMISNPRVLSEEFVVQTLSYSMREVLQHWTESSIIPSSKEGSVWRNKKAPKKVPFSSWKTDRLPDLRVLPGHWCRWSCRELCRPFCSCSSQWWYSGIRYKMVRNSIIDDTNPILWHLGKLVQIKNTRVWEIQDRIGIVQYGDSSEEGWTWWSQIENYGEEKYRAEFENEEFLGPKRKLWKERRGQEYQGTKQRGQRTLGDCWQWKANGQCSKGDNCSFRHDINKRAKLTQPNPSPSSFMQQNERNASRTRSPKGKSPSGRMSRWPCKDYLKGTCTNSFCEKWHLQYACFTSQKMDADLVKSALMHTARLMNSLAEGLKRMVTKVQWLYWKLHDNWVAYFKMWSRQFFTWAIFGAHVYEKCRFG